jgi:aminoacylase
MSDWENNEEIKLFREYLRIPSVHPDINYGNLKKKLLKLSS